MEIVSRCTCICAISRAPRAWSCTSFLCKSLRARAPCCGRRRRVPPAKAGPEPGEARCACLGVLRPPSLPVLRPSQGVLVCIFFVSLFGLLFGHFSSSFWSHFRGKNNVKKWTSFLKGSCWPLEAIVGGFSAVLALTWAGRCSQTTAKNNTKR